MTDFNLNSQTTKPRRYTVPYLLEIARIKDKSFDLSKFSYDAAKAGVVPPLGSYVVAPRRLTNPKPRGWSSESFDAMDDSATGQRIKTAGNLLRQPRGPPADQESQKDEGFVRFLKKHSSPTHQRVTAGGRIVPMEQRPTLSPLSAKTMKNTEGPKVEVQKTETSTTNHEASLTNGLTHHQTSSHANEADERMKSINFDPQMPQDGIDHTFGDGFNVLPGFFPVSYISSMPSPPAFLGNHLGNASWIPNSLLPDVTNDVAMSLPVQTGSVGGMTLPLSWPYSGPSMISPIESGLPTAPTMHTSNQFAIHQALSQAEVLFQDLNRQLQTIDRHRAMSNHDPALAAHRIAIVQQRSSAKDNIRFWKSQLAMAPSQKEQTLIAGPHSRLHGSAESYVPRTEHGDSDIMKGVISGNQPSSIANSNEISLPRPRRKAIPIVPPPVTPVDRKKTQKGNTQAHIDAVSPLSPGEQLTDCWGARVGPMPPSLEQEQRELLQKMKNGTQASQVNEKKIEHDSNDKTSCYDEIEWQQSSTGLGSNNSVLTFERQGGPMRKLQHSDISVNQENVVMPEPVVQPLPRSPRSQMTEFEREYWTRKPEIREAVFPELRQLQNRNTAEENKSTDRRWNEQYESTSAEYLLGGTTLNMSANGMNNNTFCSPVSDRMDFLPNFDPNDSYAISSSRQGVLQDSQSDSLKTKGQTSVAVQNIHAMARLPQSLDGTSELLRPSAIHLLAAASRQKNLSKSFRTSSHPTHG